MDGFPTPVSSFIQIENELPLGEDAGTSASFRRCSSGGGVDKIEVEIIIRAGEKAAGGVSGGMASSWSSIIGVDDGQLIFEVACYEQL
nr:hypothetical protein Iba_chr10dCG10330 [Ipomoea batatas]